MEKKANAKNRSSKLKNGSKKGNLQKSPRKKDFLVVGLGASAGGVKALQEFFATMPPNSGMAFVAILHLSPEHESNLAQIIQTQTEMRVTQVNETVKVEPNNVYVIPPNVQLEMVDGVIRPAEAERPHGHRVAIDVFFRTLAEAYERNAVCVVLSGTGSDGTLGLKRVKESNGFAIVQDPDDAEYDSMPRSAINTQLVDWVLPVNRMPEKLIGFKESSERLHLTNGADAEKIAEEIRADESLREILTLLRVRTGHDFSNYKTPTLIRRVARHLQIHELEDIPSYLELLRNNPHEIQSLLKNLLINVTNFFRDKEAFNALEIEVIPKIFAGKTGRDTVRVWSCGCASGEEAYSLAMILSECADKLADPPKIQVFASDVDDEAIAEAREHRYPESIESDVSGERLKRFFTKEGSFYRVKKELRETVLFAPHNVLRDPPFSRLDLVVCRNLLIYLNRETQERVLQIFHFALQSHGYLFLGSSETAESMATLFAPVDKKQRIYSRRVAPIAQNTLPVMPVAGRWEVRLPEKKSDAARDRAATLSEIHYKLLENYAPSSVLVNQDFDIVYLSGAAGKFLRFVSGEPSRNLLKAVNPDLLPDLRAALFTAQREHKSSGFPNIRVGIDGEETIINLIVHAVDVQDEASDFLLVIFEERSSPAVLRESDKQIKKITDKDEAMETVVRRLEEDLQRTKEHLRFTIEQHETTVEELKAANEELQAINEELRSASEELETSKEEQQSVNEELTTVNHELKDKIDETGRINSDLQNLMAATDIATIFLDKNLQIKRYTPPVREIFNITPTDAGRPLEHFTHHLQYENLAADAEKALRSLITLEREIPDNENRTYLARFLPYRTIDDRIEGVVLNFIDITDRKRAEEKLRESEERLQKAIAIETVGVLFFNNAFEITDCNEAFVRMSGYTRDEIRAGRFSWEEFTPDGFVEASSRAIAEMISSGIATPYEKEYVRKDGSRFWALFAAKRISDDEIVEFITDITEQKRAEAVVRESEEKYRTLFDSIDEGVGTIELIFDENERAVDYIYLEQNPAFERLTGLPSDVIGKRISQVVPDLEAFWFETFERVAKTGEPERFEHQVAALDKWFEVYVSRIGDAGSRKIVYVYNDITERKRAAEKQAFLPKLSDALRPLADAEEIRLASATVLGRHLKANRVAYAENISDEECYEVTRNYVDGAFEVTGRYRYADYGSDILEQLESGQIRVQPNIQDDSRLSDAEKQALAEAGVGASLNVPLVKNGRLVAFLGVNYTAAHDFKPDEIELVKETAERTWAAVERARAEEALRESETRYRLFLNAVSDIFYKMSADWSEMHLLEGKGFLSNTENPSLSWLETYIPDTDKALVQPTIAEAVRAKSIFELEHRVIRADGSIGWAFSRAIPFLDAEGEIVEWFGAATDITERKEAEAALRESEENYRTLFTSIDEGFCTIEVLFDKRGKAVDYVFLETNPAFERQTGLKNAVGKKMRELAPEQEEFWFETYGHIAKTGEAMRFEHEAAALGKFYDVYAFRIGSLEENRVAVIFNDITERIRIERIVHESEERLRLATEAAEAYSWEYDIKTETYKFSANAPKILGIAKKNLPRTIEDTFALVHPDDKRLIEKTLKTAIRTGEGFTLDFRTVTQRGKIVWLAVQSAVVKDEKEQSSRIIGIAQNITERKVADELLRESEERMRIAIEAGELATWEWDIEDGKVIWNERHFTLFGMKPTPDKPMKPEDFFYHVYPDDRDWVGERLQKAVEKKTPFDAEFRAVIENDGVRWMDGYGRVTETDKRGKATKMSGVMFDVTTRKRAEEALRKSEEQLQMVLESTKDYAIITYDLKGFITRWNSGAERIFGYTEKEAVGRYGAFLFTSEDQAQDIPEREMKIALEKGRAEDERWHIRKNGSRFFASGVMQPLKDGKIEGFVKIARDQTERIEVETALREKETLPKLVTAQEDERKRIARDLHDELGQQLTALRIKLDAVSKNYNEPVLLNQLNEIQNIARSIDDGVDFLAWELRPSTLDDLGLVAALDNYIKQWSHYAKVKAELTVLNLKRARFAPEVETCLYRIVQEALNNTHKHAGATNADIVLEKRGNRIILIIEDNGKGFNRENKMNRQKGIGLIGMKERAALVGGTLEIESAPKKGTTIYVRIPFSAVKDIMK